MTARHYQMPAITKAVILALAALCVFVASWVAMTAHDALTAPKPSFRLVEGQAQILSIDGKSKVSPSTHFALSPNGGRYWSQALNREDAQSLRNMHPLVFKFYVQESVKPTTEAKTFGLWVNGRLVKSLEESLANDEGNMLILSVLSPLMLLFGCWIAYVVLKNTKPTDSCPASPSRSNSK